MNLPTLEEIIQNNKQESTFSRLLRESEILQNATYEDFIPSQEELEEVKLWIEQGKRTYLRYCEEYR